MTMQSFIHFNAKDNTLVFEGEWNLSHLTRLKKELDKILKSVKQEITIDAKNISALDSAGAWLITNAINKLSANQIKVNLHNLSDQYKNILSLNKKPVSRKDIPKVEILGWRAQLGKYALEQLDEFYEFVNFIGELFFETLRVSYHPKFWRLRSVISTINKTGAAALPIIALLSFMIGIVISYQMGNQLRQYGANIFIVNLLGLSVLREFGPLLTAIIVAGRTGSAFTAQIGTMKINQELDALISMGITPAELLLLPRLIGLVIILPLLTIWADIFGVLGGMLMAHNMLNITWGEFLRRFQHEIPLRALIIGLGKAPIFALIIASISCFQGIKVHGSAEDVGVRTTRSVVLGIFFIIITDAILSVILSKYKL